jgi:hypothetical protein
MQATPLFHGFDLPLGSWQSEAPFTALDDFGLDRPLELIGVHGHHHG